MKRLLMFVAAFLLLSLGGFLTASAEAHEPYRHGCGSGRGGHGGGYGRHYDDYHGHGGYYGYSQRYVPYGAGYRGGYVPYSSNRFYYQQPSFGIYLRF